MSVASYTPLKYNLVHAYDMFKIFSIWKIVIIIIINNSISGAVAEGEGGNCLLKFYPLGKFPFCQTISSKKLGLINPPFWEISTQN